VIYIYYKLLNFIFLNKLFSYVKVDVMCSTEILVKVHPFICDPIKEKEIQAAKSCVLTNYYRRYKSTAVSHHGQKMNRVHGRLCEFIRRTDQILSYLLERKKLTLQEYESISAETTTHDVADHLLRLLCSKPASAYQSLLQVLDVSNQHHLHCLLEDEGMVSVVNF